MSFQPNQRHRLIELIYSGATIKEASRAVGTTPQTVNNWRRRGESEDIGPYAEFAQQLENARAKVYEPLTEEELVERIERKARQGHFKAIEFFASPRTNPTQEDHLVTNNRRFFTQLTDRRDAQMRSVLFRRQTARTLSEDERVSILSQIVEEHPDLSRDEQIALAQQAIAAASPQAESRVGLAPGAGNDAVNGIPDANERLREVFGK